MTQSSHKRKPRRTNSLGPIPEIPPRSLVECTSCENWWITHSDNNRLPVRCNACQGYRTVELVRSQKRMATLIKKGNMQ